jgi:hypothetical protein
VFTPEFFKSTAWHKVIESYTKIKDVPPIVEIHCSGGESFKVFKLYPWKSCLLLEIYGEKEKTLIRFLPYEQIIYVDVKEESEEHIEKRKSIGLKVTKEYIGFKIPKEEE